MRLRSISKRARTGCNGTKFLCWQGSPAWWSSQEQEGGGTAGESSLYLILDLTLDRAAAFLILRVRASLARWHTMSYRVHSILRFVIVNFWHVTCLSALTPGRRPGASPKGERKWWMDRLRSMASKLGLGLGTGSGRARGAGGLEVWGSGGAGIFHFPSDGDEMKWVSLSWIAWHCVCVAAVDFESLSV